MSQAINAYYTITASSEFRERERLHEKARRDEAQALHHAEQVGIQKGIQQGMQQIARKLLQRNRPINEIVEDTGLSAVEIKRLREEL